jgi:hypothetical protein
MEEGLSVVIPTSAIAAETTHTHKQTLLLLQTHPSPPHTHAQMDEDDKPAKSIDQSINQSINGPREAGGPPQQTHTHTNTKQDDDMTHGIHHDSFHTQTR